MSKSFTDRQRVQIFDRDGHECVVWGWFIRCGGGLTVQHRAARQAGGSKVMNFLENGLVMCAVHNALDMSDTNFRQHCLNNGYSIARWVVEPSRGERDSEDLRIAKASSVPVRYIDGWYRLSGGSRELLGDSVAVDMMKEIYGA